MPNLSLIQDLVMNSGFGVDLPPPPWNKETAERTEIDGLSEPARWAGHAAHHFQSPVFEVIREGGTPFLALEEGQELPMPSVCGP